MKITFTTQHNAASTLNGSHAAHNVYSPLRRLTLLVTLLMTFALGARAQAVIMSGDYFLTHNDDGTSVNVTGTTTFNPATCLWQFAQDNYIRTADNNGDAITSNNNYLQYTSLALGNDGFNWYRARNNENIYHRTGTSSNNRTYYYLRINGTNWQISNNNSNNGKLIQVTITNNIPLTITNPTINGNDVLTATGNYTYTASGAVYQAGGYSNYRFNTTDHYFDNNTAIKAATLSGTAWSISTNEYATINSSGVVTVNRIPISDVTLTITATVSVTDGIPAAPAGTTLVGTKEITIQGSVPAAPTISVSGTTVTLQTDATGTTSIRYTIDGTDPTATTGMVYSGAFDISGSTNSPVTIKAITVRNGYASSVTTQQAKLTLPEPVIKVNATAGTATITWSNSSATIYYTTDGSTPSATNGTRYNGQITGLATMATVKAIAICDGWNSSSVASATVTIPSGVSPEGTVTLFDLEDHNWTYYSGVNESVDGGNYNTQYAGKLYSPNPRNVKITYNGVNGISGSSTNVKVSISESENAFVYYKTLEQGSTSGEYPYQVISNPFSVRPSTGSGNSKVYYGFAGWKIKSGGNYIKNYDDGDVLPLDADIVFEKLPYNSVNCISAEIVLETTWKKANRTYVSSNPGSNQTYNTSGDYESNFYVINCNYTRTITASQPVTIMMVEPDGSADYRNSNTFTGNITPNNTGVTKIEYAKWNSTNTVNANFRNLWIGRGMTTTSQCASLITGLNTTQSTAGRKFSIKVESGKYDYFDFYKGHSTYTGGTDNTNATITGTSANAIITIGNDYDRAQASTNNQNLEFKYGPMFGYQSNFSSRDNRDNSHTLDLTVKSGRIGYTFFMENTTNNNYLQGGAGYCMYLSSAGAHTNVGRRNVLIEGGDICTIGSGIDCYNNAPSNSDTPDETINYNRLAFNVRIKGGTIHGNVYGGAAQSPSGGNRVMVMTGGHVKGWFAAGCNGTGADGGQNYGTSWVYIGGTAKVDSEGSAKVLGYASGGNVYAAGAGRTGTTTCGEMTFGSNLVIADESYIERGAYGGGNYGYALSETNIYITGGTNEGKDGTVNDVTTKGGVFGGANQQNGPTINMYMTGGLMKGGVYGGCNTQGTISDDVTMQINGGQVGTSSQPANIHGGGYGKNTAVKGSVDMTLGIFGQETKGVEVWGDVYGGSALGYVNFSPTINNNQITGGNYTQNTYTNVTMNKATINGSLYGGALGDASTPANVYGPVEVKVRGGSVKATSVAGSGGVYGANNINGAPQRSVSVDIYGTDPAPAEGEYALYAVYGGGNQADYLYGNGYPTVTVHGCDNSIEYVYGGGNAAAVKTTNVTIWGGNVIGNVFGGGHGYKDGAGADVEGDVNVAIKGGTIKKVFGGSNSKGNISGTIKLDINKDGDCDMRIGEVYGGGNEAAGNAGTITIGCTGGKEEGIGDVYGGANAADINTPIILNITGGNISRVFGGNNTSGSINGDIAVNVNWDTENSCGVNYLGNVYGAGNQAAYSGNTEVNILNGTITGSVYGGGLGADAVVTGTTTVNINGSAEGHSVAVTQNVLGGGDAAAVEGSTDVNIINGAVSGSVFGGGNAAGVSENGVVEVTGGTIASGVYGGSNASGTVGNTTVTLANGTIGTDAAHANVHGGGYGKETEVSGNVAVNIQGGTIYGDVYGGSALGTVNTDANNTTAVNLTGGLVHGDAYGGGLGDSDTAADVNGNVTVTLNGTAFTLATTKDNENNIIPTSGRVFGCNNINGSPKGTVLVKVERTVGGANKPEKGSGVYELQAVYGGGNLAAYNRKPIVTVHNCDNSIEYVYGGGNAAAVAATDVTIWGGNVIGNVFGGGNGTVSPANVNGDATTKIYGGTILNVYGGSNSQGTIGGTINVTVNSRAENSGDNPCTMNIGSVYGGGNLAASNVGNLTITCTGTDGRIDNVYGGANQANITGDIDLKINGGNIGNVFGGNNIKGDISGTISVTVGDDPNDCGVFKVDNVYGAGNLAPYGSDSNNKGNYPVVNIYSGTVTNNVFGGGLGESAIVYGNPQVTIGDAVAEHIAIVRGDVYGGGDAADVKGTPLVKVVNDCNTQIGNVYGGGNAADVNGTNVTIDGGKITGMVFGGGHGDKNADPQTEANVTGNVKVLVTGGTINKVFGGSNSKGNIGGTIALNIEKGDESCELHITEVYGGGNEAAGNAGTITIACTGGEGEGIADVYGGANAADINTPITLNITGGNIKRVFGGNNASGAIKGDIAVNVNWDTENPCGVNYLGNVYGAGNQAAYSGNTEVNILNGTVTGSVYGGGLGAMADVTGTTTVNIDGSAEGHSVAVTQNVLGGGDAAAVTGSTDVNIINGAISGSVFGGGNAAGVSENGVVEVTGGTIASGVYGGSNASGTVGNTTVTLANGTIGTDAAHANVHGGGYGKETEVSGNVAVNIQGGTIYGDVYGGSALGTVNTDANNTTAVNLTGGLVHGDAYGGGLGDSDTAADVNGNVTVTLNGTAFTLATTKDNENNIIPTSGRVFGCNNINGSPKGTVLVQVLQTVARNSDGTLKDKPEIGSGVYELQAVYGGGNLAAYKPANPKANGQFTSYTWGEKNVAHVNTNKPVQVVIDGCYETSIEYVYGGGNAAATPATDVTVLGSYEIGSVFGGGNGKDRYTLDGGTTWKENLGADVGIINAAAYATDKSGKYGTGNAMTSVLGGTVHNIFGGSNTLGNIVGEATAYLDAASDCELNVDGIYGGGNEAYMDGSSGIQLGCITYLKEIYGGARNADVGGDINLTITSGHFDRVFGGNNLGGLVEGSITVNIEETGCNPITIGELYGCGNKAAYTTPGDRHPTINIRSFTSIGNVYGGGLGKEAVVTGNPTININVVKGVNNAVEWSDNRKTINFDDGSTVTLPVHETGKIGAIGNVFGGGNAAAVIGNTQVNIGTATSVVFESLTGAERTKTVEGADIRGNVYGGGNQADVLGTTDVQIGAQQ